MPIIFLLGLLAIVGFFILFMMNALSFGIRAILSLLTGEYEKNNIDKGALWFVIILLLIGSTNALLGEWPTTVIWTLIFLFYFLNKRGKRSASTTGKETNKADNEVKEAVALDAEANFPIANTQIIIQSNESAKSTDRNILSDDNCIFVTK